MSQVEDLPRATISSEVRGVAYIPHQVGADFVHFCTKGVLNPIA